MPSGRLPDRPPSPASLAGPLAAWAARVNRRLPELLPPPGERPEPVHQAMHYALTGAGKRVRPVLTLAVADLFGARTEPVLDLACAVEMVHACSLVLDDLPSMDDAALRRGRPPRQPALCPNAGLTGP